MAWVAKWLGLEPPGSHALRHYGAWLVFRDAESVQTVQDRLG